MKFSSTQRITWLHFGIGLAIVPPMLLASAGVLIEQRSEAPVGTGRAYEILGDLPVKHRGRLKPLLTMAIEEVTLIHGDSTIKLFGPDGKTTLSWQPVAALLDWSARPESWDDQDFVLVDYPPLKRLLLGATIREQVRSLAENQVPEVSKALEALAATPELTEADLLAAARQADEAGTTGKRLKSLAVRLGADHKWLSPSVLQNARLQYEGHTLTFPQWAGEILGKKEKARFDAMAAALKLLPLEEKAAEVAERLSHYLAIRDHDSRAIDPLDLLVVPRPRDEIYRGYSTQVFERGMQPDQPLSPLEANVASTLLEFLEGLESKDWALPGEDAVFDQKFTTWLNDYSLWIPLGVILKGDLSELTDAGLPSDEVVALRKVYREFEDAARAAPGNVPESVAVRVIAAARALATNYSPSYPTHAVMARESHFNRLTPFSKAVMAYGFSLVLLLMSFGGTVKPRAVAETLRAVVYGLGLAGLTAGILLELYGFWLRLRIGRWGPVTNMYETLIWVALITAILGLLVELRWRKKYAAFAASGIALLATVVAENTSVLDPTIRAIPRVLRINRLLVGHVLPIVSGYAAFALALGLGLLAVGCYLTASYNRTATYRELAWPLVPGIPLIGLGYLGIELFYRHSPLSVVDSHWLDFATVGLAAAGAVLTIVAGFSILGEFANRFPGRTSASGIILVAVGSTVLIAGNMATTRGLLENSLSASIGWLAASVGSSLAVMGHLAVRSNEAPARIESLASVIYRLIQVGVVLLVAGTIVGGIWARQAWGRFWGWDPKEVCVLIILVAYLVPLHGRFARWMNTFGFAAASVVCFTTIMMSWYGLNVVSGVALHNFGFINGQGRGIVMACMFAVLSALGAATWRRSRSQRS